MTSKAAQYMRMSSDQQPCSIDNQQIAIAKYANKNGLEIVATYVDEARTGLTIRGRSGMQQLLRDVMEDTCPFDTVLVLDVSRWGRFQDVDEAAYYEFHCRKNGVRVQYVAETFSSGATPFGSILKQLKRAMAGEYSRELGVKVRSGQANLVSRGFAAGALPCIGYRRVSVSSEGVSGRMLEPGERKSSVTDHVRWVLGPDTEVKAVERIFHDYVSGVPMARIVKRLNAEGVRTHDDKSFTKSKVRHLLDNEIVVGSFVWGQRKGRPPSLTGIGPYQPVKYEGMVPSIIDLPTWNATKKKLLGNQHFRNHGLSSDELIEQLRQVLRKKPTLRSKDFLVNGLSNPSTYLKHFGSIFSAYALAGRSHDESEKELTADRSKAQSVRQRFIRDVHQLAGSLGIKSELQTQAALIRINGVEVKVRGARPLPSVLGPRWYACHVHRVKADGRWLLVVRLNEGGQTGQDFFLMPPDVHAKFTGLINRAIALELEPYRYPDVWDLMHVLRKLKPETAPVDKFEAPIVDFH
jgi:DNA invertase Pin-like site-specific DNA recombinase